MPQTKTKAFAPQHQEKQPGIQSIMKPQPEEVNEKYKGSGKLKDKVALITGGDSGIGRSVAILFAREGADVSFVYYNEHDDAKRTKELVECEGRRCSVMPGDVGDPQFCKKAVESAAAEFKKIDILVNNAASQPFQDSIETLSDEQLDRTFRINIFSYLYMARECVKYFKEGSCIINTTSITAYRGSAHLLDYSATKGAIVSFTRSLSLILADKGIRVNAVAPGPIWTPLIPSTYPAEYVARFGANVPMKRAGQPSEVAPCYVFLASEIDSSYMSGQVLHPNGGYIING